MRAPHGLGMDSPAPMDTVLERYSASLREIYGDRLERAVLFGSRARGDAGQDSDYDVAVFLREMVDRF
jgi:predicted nucleotidyltransferase